MCGVLFSNKKNLDLSLFRESLADLHDRGPDHTGWSKVGDTLLGHTRLAVIDLNNRSDQPFFSKKSSAVIVYNGEIFNYLQLKKQFSLDFINSDTELILELYNSVGENFLKHLNGMFSFVIYDPANNKIFAARDRLGIKPLYYNIDKEGYIIFSSEISPILKILGPKEFDQDGLEIFRNFRTFIGNMTAYKDIYSFPPGTYYINGDFKKYWSLDLSEKMPPEDTELDELLTSSINECMLSDIPIGAYLSGGIDSTLVVNLAKIKNTWIVGMKNNNEFFESRRNSEFLSTNHTSVLVSAEEFIEMAVHIIKKNKVPIPVPNQVLLTILNKKVKESNSVMLSGEGSDELFAGYDKIFRWAATTKSLKAADFAKYLNYTESPNLELFEEVLRQEKLETPYLTISSYFQQHHLKGLLSRADSASMAYGVEVRVPFVNHVLVDRLFGVPFSWKNKFGISKYPLRKLASSFLPEEVAFQKKIGFPVDINQILAQMGISTSKHPYDSWYQFNMKILGVG